MNRLRVIALAHVGRRAASLLAALFVVFAVGFAPLATASAATYMTKSAVILYNMNASASGAFAIAFTAGAADAAGTVTINFGTWGGTVNTTQTVTIVGCPAMTGASTGLPGSLTAAGSGNVVTISGVTALTSGTSYCAILSSATALTNPTSGVYTVTTTDGTDSSTPAIDVIPNDQVVVTAVVPPTFTLALSGNTDSYVSNLTSTNDVSTTGVTATINTNAASGWLLWAEDTQAGLKSSSNTHLIPTVTPGSNVNLASGHGTEQYALGVTSITTGTIAPFYNDGGHTGGGLSTTTYNQIASNTAPSATDNVVVKELANISATTPAANDYSDTVTLIGAGSF
jgi:hypothetical protein